MKILFVTAVLFAVAASGVYSQACHLREVDLCMAIGMFHFQSNGVPSDEEKVNEWCETMKEVDDCMGNFSSKCLSPLQREIMGLMSGAEDNAKELCKPGTEVRARYLKYGECLAEGADSDEFKGHMADIKVMVEKLFLVPYEERFPLLCCGMRRFHEDVEEMAKRRCGEESVEMIQSIIKMIMSDMPATLCQSYNPYSDDCQAILPAKGTPPTPGQNKSQISKLLDTVFGDN